MCRAYVVDDNVLATAIVGSVARGWADAYSDIEILVVWAEPPSKSMRLAAVARAGGHIDIDWAESLHADWRAALAARNGLIGEMWPFQDDEFAEHFPVQGVAVGVSGFTAATIEAICHELLVQHRPTDDAEMVASSIIDAWDVSGTDRLAVWQQRLANYPIELATSVVVRELEVDPEWWGVEALAHRNDLLALDAALLRMRRRIFRLLLALNRRYLVDPRPKWTQRLVQSMPQRPSGVELLWSPPRSRSTPAEVASIRALLENTLAIVEDDLPAVDIAAARRWFDHQRGPWERPR